MSATSAPGLAESLRRLGTETAFSVLARAKELERAGCDVIHLEIGEPDFATPLHICEVAAEAMRVGQTHYCPSAGMAELREEAAAYLSRPRGVDVDPGEGPAWPGGEPCPFL